MPLYRQHESCASRRPSVFLSPPIAGKPKRGAFIRPLFGQGENGFLGRWKDVLTGKGADVYIGKKRLPGPSRAEATRFQDLPPVQLPSRAVPHDDRSDNWLEVNRSCPRLGVDSWRTPPWAERRGRRFHYPTRKYVEWGGYLGNGPADYRVGFGPGFHDLRDDDSVAVVYHPDEVWYDHSDHPGVPSWLRAHYGTYGDRAGGWSTYEKRSRFR
ncbi:MAG: hypothetical protein M1837_003632 [Sclerophora amabilis]|nr:MAG: hypothetical protein M1837_003632 [Sclerophora amabilis]